MKSWPTDAEMAVMKILQDNPRGLYALQVVDQADGAIKRGSIYVLLGRLTLKGFIKMTKPKEAQNYPGLPRPIYRLSPEGLKVVRTAYELRHLAAGASA